MDWTRERVGGYKYLREIDIAAAMPLTDLGKVDRKALRRTLETNNEEPQ